MEIHFLMIAIFAGLVAFAASLAEGFVAYGMLQACYLQPAARNDIVKMGTFGLIFIEGILVLVFVIAALLLMGPQFINQYYSHLSELGIALSIGLAGIVTVFASSLPAYAACMAIARQPFFSYKILRFALLSQAIIQTPVLFAFIIALLIKGRVDSVVCMTDALRLIAVGLSIGLGSIGPVIGLGIFNKSVIETIGFDKTFYSKAFSFSVISQVIIETPVLFALVISLLTLFLDHSGKGGLHSIALLAGSFGMGLCTLGTGIYSGLLARSAVRAMSHSPEQSQELAQVSALGQTVIDSSAIYGFIIALGLMFFA